MLDINTGRNQKLYSKLSDFGSPESVDHGAFDSSVELASEGIVEMDVLRSGVPSPEEIGVTFSHSFKVKENDRLVERSVDVRLEPFVVHDPSHPDVNRLIELEQIAWSANGIEVPRVEVLERLFGNPEVGRVANPVIVAKVDDQIEGAIFMSFVDTGGHLDRIPANYQELAASHDPDGDTVFDFSVLTNPETREFKLFSPLVEATANLALITEKNSVIAYSRAELFLHHSRHNPELRQRFGVEVNGKVQVDALSVFSHFKDQNPSPSLNDYVDFFGFEIGEAELEKITTQQQVRCKSIGIKPEAENIRSYFSLEDWRSPTGLSSEEKTQLEQSFIENYVEHHIQKVGGPFLASTHQALGAQYVHLIPNGRPTDLRGLGANVMMEYDLSKFRALKDLSQSAGIVCDLRGNTRGA